MGDLEKMRDCKVMIRAHGEPPATYLTAKRNNIEIIDATCPIVLKLQRDVKRGYEQMKQQLDPRYSLGFIEIGDGI